MRRFNAGCGYLLERPRSGAVSRRPTGRERRCRPDRRGRRSSRAQSAPGAGCAQHRRDQAVEFGGEAPAPARRGRRLEARIVARHDTAAVVRLDLQFGNGLRATRSGNRSRCARAAAHQRRVARRRLGMGAEARRAKRWANAIATVWRRLNLLCSPSVGAAMLHTRSVLASMRNVTPAMLSALSAWRPRKTRAHSIGACVK